MPSQAPASSMGGFTATARGKGRSTTQRCPVLTAVPAWNGYRRTLQEASFRRQTTRWRMVATLRRYRACSCASDVEMGSAGQVRTYAIAQWIAQLESGVQALRRRSAGSCGLTPRERRRDADGESATDAVVRAARIRQHRRYHDRRYAGRHARRGGLYPHGGSPIGLVCTKRYGDATPARRSQNPLGLLCGAFVRRRGLFARPRRGPKAHPRGGSEPQVRLMVTSFSGGIGMAYARS